MGSIKRDLTGLIVGRLTVVGYAGTFGGVEKRHAWKCLCDCGGEKIVFARHILSGHTRSCGCLMGIPQSTPEYVAALKRRAVSRRIKTPSGYARTRPYRIWVHMHDRCYNPNCSGYRFYGGRGITVCDEWRRSFVDFLGWAMANGYADHLTIDRVDNDLGYSPSNCRWLTIQDQQLNKRTGKRRVAGR